MTSYPGGKSGAGVWQRIICDIPPHDTWVSAFAGHCAVTRHIRPAARQVIIDRDPAVMDWWADWPVERYCCDSVEWLRHQFGMYRVRPRPPFVAAVPGGSAADRRGYLPAGTPIPATAAAVAGSGVARSSGPGGAAETIGVGSRTFVYADPPYPMTTRIKRRLYAHEMTEDQHRELLRVVTNLPCYVMLHSYPSELYRNALADWRTWTYRAMTRGGKLATEQVWCNYPAPHVLHDYRWLGRSKREREKLARRRRNLLRWLADLPERERQQLLVAIADEFGDAVPDRRQPSPDPESQYSEAGDGV